MIGFVDAIKMFYQRYVDFEGRSAPAEYWWIFLFQMIVYSILAILGFALGVNWATEEPNILGWIALILCIIFLFANVIPGIAVIVRRFHDQDKSGWFYLLGFIPYVGGIVIIVFMCLGGTPGGNRFGPDPYGREIDAFD